MNVADKEQTVARRGRILTGQVVSDAMDKTVIVLIERRVRHPLYGKIIRRSTRIPAHDADNKCHKGDWVTIQECRPLSRTKSWTVTDIRAS
ncbi:MAG: 30S ribosomal protein S17 [Gammaproteobacteria bacterium]